MRAFILSVLAKLTKKRLIIFASIGVLLLVGKPPATVRAQGLSEEYITEFAAIAAQAAQHFGGNVAVYEIWNEQDLHSPASIYLPPGDYARLLEAAYGAIKAVSSSTVIVGGLASGNIGYLSSVISAQGGNLKADGVGVHPYIIDIGPLRAKVQEYLGASQGKPLWITEFGWETTNQEDQANYLEQAFNVFRSFTRIRSSAWYCWSDRMGPGFGLITVSGTPKLAYHRFPAGEGVNIDPIHSDTPSATQLRDLGASWVRMVYRPQMSIDFDGLIQGYKNAGIETILILNQETLWSEDLPPSMLCELRMGTIGVSPIDTVHSALKEKNKASCHANWLERIKCIIEDIINFFFTVDESFNYDETAGSTALRRVQQQALNSSSPYEGIIARMLPPNYRQLGLDPMLQLSRAEGQKAEGLIVSNKEEARELDVGSGQYEVSEEAPYTRDYVLDAKFPDIPALTDKYGFIRQGFVPGAPLASLPYVNCPTSSLLIEFDEPIRDVDWKAQSEGGQEVPCNPDNPDDPDCGDPLPHPPAECPATCAPDQWFAPPEGAPNCGYCGCGEGYSARCNMSGTGWDCVPHPGLCGDNNCPCTGATSVYVEAPIDTHTEVAVVGEAWQNIAGGSEVDASGNILKVGGALDIFTLPGANFKREPSLEAKSSFTYQSNRAGSPCGGGGCLSKATLPIKDMGGVEGAFGCVVDQLLETPANAAEGICEEWMENVPGEEEEEGYIPSSRQAVLGQGTAGIQQSGGFWVNLGNLVGRLLRSILSF